jgi:hypothetical protein
MTEKYNLSGCCSKFYEYINRPSRKCPFLIDKHDLSYMKYVEIHIFGYDMTAIFKLNSRLNNMECQHGKIFSVFRRMYEYFKKNMENPLYITMCDNERDDKKYLICDNKGPPTNIILKTWLEGSFKLICPFRGVRMDIGISNTIYFNEFGVKINFPGLYDSKRSNFDFNKILNEHKEIIGGTNSVVMQYFPKDISFTIMEFCSRNFMVNIIKDMMVLGVDFYVGYFQDYAGYCSGLVFNLL